MKNVEYIIVGDGYAAMFFAHQLIKNNKKFCLFSEGKKSASHISAGIINPLVLKRFTTFWLASEQIHHLHQTLSEIQEYTGKNYLIDQPIHRIFHDETEKNLWIKKANDEILKTFLNKNFTSIEGVTNPFSTGKVNCSARLNVENFFLDMLEYLEKNIFLTKEKFDYSEINLSDNSYKNIHFTHIIFCEGMGVTQNPFFSDLPVNPNKGHHLKVVFPNGFKQSVTIKKKHFLFPTNEHEYYYGGTYDRNQTHSDVDQSAKEQLRNGLKEFFPGNFEITEVNFGFRPTVKDRRPILGRHQKHENLFVFNGLGARGILNGCYFSKTLFEHIENNQPLPPEVDLKRFA